MIWIGIGTTIVFSFGFLAGAMWTASAAAARQAKASGFPQRAGIGEAPSSMWPNAG